MMPYSRPGRVGSTLLLALLVAACSTGERPARSAAPIHATTTDEIEAIATLLDAGDQRRAKKRITAALKGDPGNARLMLLRDSIVRDPQELLGPTSFSYTVKSGDTIGGLAQQFLGNRLKSHQLARYNGILGAATLTPGQSLRIPGDAPRAVPVKRAEPQAPAARPRAPQRAAAVAPRATAVPANPAAARQARSAGLAALNEGNPGRAVNLLSRAAALDPANPAISRDLQRAQRVNAAVKARQ